MSYTAGQTLTAEALNEYTASDWAAYSCSWLTFGAGADPTLGDGTLTARWAQIGKIVIVKIRLVWGSTTSAGSGDWTFSLPVAPAVNASTNVGTALTLDAGTAYKSDVCVLDNSLTLRVIGIAIGGFYNATTPQTWAVNDFTAMELVYEAA
jgi:hypothetical protein